ncbi:MAG: DNA mismatch repair protein MutS [Deltaproteobacteria bacterium]|nr:DNA mismatch repair protein MutS [Deltaproteobacteria bacterium]
MVATPETPMLKQYFSIKSQYTDSILFFRLGDFYEMFYEDAVEASKILEIALTSRNKGESAPVPLCGIPYHSCQPYIAKLLAAGKKVAICEQVEDPKMAKGIVKREVVRIITPGMVLDDTVLEATKPNYLACLYGDRELFLSYLDISTGEFRAGLMPTFETLLDELTKLDSKEILIPLSWDKGIQRAKIARHLPQALISILNETEFNKDSVQNLNGVKNMEERCPSALVAAGGLYNYVCYTQKSVPSHISTLQLHETKNFLILDEAAQKNLELLKTGDHEKRGSLLHLLDETVTPMGARKLRQWLLYPLVDVKAIEERQQSIATLMETYALQENLQKNLVRIADLERLVARIAIQTANARDLVALARSLEVFPALIEAFQNQEGLLGEGLALLQNFEPLAKKIRTTLVEEPPLALKEGGLIREGFHSELDALKKISGSGKGFIAALEEKEKKATGINSMKVRFNNIFGYYLEITHTHKDKVPAHYIRKQTLVNAERYITPELKEYEEKVLGAEEKIERIEYELFLQLREELSTWSGRIQKAAHQIATLDTLYSLMKVAQKCRWTSPELMEKEVLEIKEGRHPIVEAISEDRFVPNDMHLDAFDNRFLIITGPNMAGKSTVMRQTALIVILAQMGSFVPAMEVRMGLFDRIFTRVGASDRLSRGESTFMVEMVEAAHILKEATSRSLVLIDEIGRGTSTYDGVAIAWAVAEYLHNHNKAKTLFATHYHELIELPNTCPGMKNFNIAVKEWNDKIIFLRKLVPGGTSRSYGVEVAKLAGLPEAVITKAKEILGQWEHFASKKEIPAQKEQLGLFSSAKESAICKELKDIDVNRLTPLQALEFLDYLKSKI